MEKETVLEIEFMPVWDKWAWKITKQNEEAEKYAEHMKKCSLKWHEKRGRDE